MKYSILILALFFVSPFAHAGTVPNLLTPYGTAVPAMPDPLALACRSAEALGYWVRGDKAVHDGLLASGDCLRIPLAWFGGVPDAAGAVIVRSPGGARTMWAPSLDQPSSEP